MLCFSAMSKHIGMYILYLFIGKYDTAYKYDTASEFAFWVAFASAVSIKCYKYAKYM